MSSLNKPKLIIIAGPNGSGKSIAFETVFSSEEKIYFLKQAKQQGYFIRLFFICTDSPIINASRIALRVMEGGHEVPISKIISRYQKSIINAYQSNGIVDRLTCMTTV